MRRKLSLLEHEVHRGMMMPEMQKTSSSKTKSKDRKEKLEVSGAQLDELLDIDGEIPVELLEAPDIPYQKFNAELSKALQKIKEGNGDEVAVELKGFFTARAHEFVSPNVDKASYYFREYVRRMDQLGKKITADTPLRSELVKFAIEEMTSKMEMLTDKVRIACISGAFANPTLREALEKVDSDVDKTTLKILQELAAFNFLKNEINNLAKGSCVATPSAPDQEPHGRKIDASTPTVGNPTSNAFASHLADLAKERKKAIEKGMEEFDRVLEEERIFINSKQEQEKTKIKPECVVEQAVSPKPESKTKPTENKELPAVEKSKPAPVSSSFTERGYPSIAEIRKLKDNLEIADAVLKFTENCKNDNERRALDKFLDELCTQKSKTICSDLNQIKQQSMKPRESMNNMLETVSYRQTAETIVPPSSRKLAEISENEKQPYKDSNIAGSVIHLLRQSVVFPEGWDVNGDAAKWTPQQFMAEFKKIAPTYSEK